MKKIAVRISALMFWFAAIGFFLYGPILYERYFAGKSINILAWPNMFDAQYLSDFEKQTGIKVHVTYFENNEELFVKLRASAGKGYDLIMPSDYVVSLLIQDGLIEKIDQSKLTFWPDIYPALQNHYFDPGNQYTIPFAWGVYGIGVNTDHALFNKKEIENSWSLIFDKKISPGQVGMLDDARELVHIAAQYLFGKKETLTDLQLQQIKELLIRQKSWVAMYTDMRSDYLLITDTSPVVVGMSTDIARILQDDPNIQFIIPKEGSFVVIDSLAMVKASKKEKEIYAFLNYLYQPKIFEKYVDTYSLLSPLKSVKSEFACFEFCTPTPQLFHILRFFNIPIKEPILNEIWIDLKS